MSEEVKEETKQEPIAQEFVYCGVRVGSDKKKSYLWARVGEPENELWFGKQLVTASVGGVYRMGETRRENGRTTVYSSGKWDPIYQRRFSASEVEEMYTAKWAAADEAARQEMYNKSLLTKAAKVEPLEDVLLRVENIAKTLNKAERRALMSKLSEACWL